MFDVPGQGKYVGRRHRRAAAAAACVVALLVTGCSDAAPSAESTVAGTGAPDTTGTTDATAPPSVEPTDRTSVVQATSGPTVAPASASTPSSVAPSQPAPARCGAVEGPAEPVTLKVWHSLGGDAVDFFDSAVREFEAEHPWISVEVEQPEGVYPAGVNDLAAMSREARPDAILGSEQTVRLQVDSGHFVPVEECGDGTIPDQFTDLLPVVATTYTVDDVLWAAPYNASTPVLMYDGMTWRAAGLDPDDPPASIDELVSAIRTVGDSTAATYGIAMYDRSAMWLITQTAAQSGRLLVEPANGHDGIDVADVNLADQWTLDVLSDFQVLAREGYVNWLGTNENDQADLNALALPADRSGMTLHTSAVLGDIYRYQEQGLLPDLEVRTGPTPGPNSGGTIGGGAWWILDKGDTTRTEAAWLLIDWLTQPARVAALAAFTGYLPTTHRAAAEPVMTDAWARWPAMRTGYDQIVAADGSPAGAGLQVGPPDVYREIELLAAWTIDGGADPSAQRAERDANVRTSLDAYEEVVGSSHDAG